MPAKWTNYGQTYARAHKSPVRYRHWAHSEDLADFVDLYRWGALPHPDGGQGPAGGMSDQLQLFLQFTDDNPYYFVEYTWDGLNLAAKDIYTDDTKAVQLFAVTYQWAANGDLQVKTVVRTADGLQAVSRYNWAPNGDLLDKTVSAT